jgi:hypothetical protein
MAGGTIDIWPQYLDHPGRQSVRAGGGCVFFLVERGAGPRVAAAIEREGAQVLPVRVAPRGVQVRVGA